MERATTEQQQREQQTQPQDTEGASPEGKTAEQSAGGGAATAERTRRRPRRAGGGRTVDARADRPGVPREAEPHAAPGAHWDRPAPQPGREGHLHRAGLDEPTPVVGTAQPPRGVSGLIRRKAYDIPEHHAKHWALLLVADRVDVLEDRLGPMLAKPLDDLGFANGSSYVRENPIGVLAGVVAGAWLTKRVLFG